MADETRWPQPGEPLVQLPKKLGEAVEVRYVRQWVGGTTLKTSHPEGMVNV